MRSYVVKRFSHFRHSRRRRIDSPSLLSRESTTLSFSNPQKGHFMDTSIVNGKREKEKPGEPSRKTGKTLKRRGWPRGGCSQPLLLIQTETSAIAPLIISKPMRQYAKVRPIPGSDHSTPIHNR